MSNPRIKDNFIIRRIDNRYFLFNLTQGTLFKLTSTAARILELCDGKHTIADIQEIICKEFEIDRNIVKNDLSQLLNKARKSRIINQPDENQYIAKESQGAKLNYFGIQWSITERCNLHCKHCYVSQPGQNELTLQEAKKFVTHLVSVLQKWKIDLADISLSGGEPFIRTDIYDIISYINQQDFDFQVRILSNGTLIDKKVARKIKELGVKPVQISLDGSTPDSHDMIRGTGSFAKAIRGIKVLQSEDIPVTIHFVVHRLNLNEVPRIIDLAIDLGIIILTITRLVPIGSGAKMKDLMLTPSELKALFFYIDKRQKEIIGAQIPLQITQNRPLWHLIDPRRVGLGGSCPIGRKFLSLLSDGTVVACPRCPIKVGDIRTESLYKIWYNSDILWQFRDKNNLKGKCRGCQYRSICGGCRAIAYGYYGDYLMSDPQCWYEPRK